ncbi:MAG TPA: VOC family protein [Kofleriaceae bacterium]|jgi:PhnB protein|nr:VOC family protein [Kofleriaceae bacterium]
MKTLSPYLSFGGDAEAALNFYAEALDGRVTELKRFSEAPQMPHPNKNEILHGRVKADAIQIMASDGKKDAQRSGISLSLEFNDNAELDRVFGKLSAGGTVTMPIAEQFWGARFGMLTDKYGVSWLLNCDTKQ